MSAEHPAKPGEIIGADLSAFQQSGGKLILWHGWGDPMVPPQATVEYYEAVANKAGGFAKAQDFARLFMVPGLDHCGINKEGPRHL